MIYTRVLILGHTGFIGSRLMEAFDQRSPDLEVVGRSRSHVDLTQMNKVETLSGLFDPKTVVVMCAAVKRQFGDTPDTFLKNVQMAANLCRLLEKQQIGRLIFFSSSAVYGEDVHNIDITEETSVYPTSYYGMAKYASECMFRKTISQQADSSLLILRPTLIYGPGDKGNTYGPVKFVNCAIRNKPITLWGDGTELREFIFINDIVETVCRMISSSYEGILNVISGRSYTFKEALDIASELTGNTLKVISRPRTKNKVDNAFHNTRISQQLEGFTFTPLKEGIVRTYEAENRSGRSIHEGLTQHAD